MAAMDPYTFDLLLGPPLAAAFSGCGNQPTAEFDDVAMGALPPPLPSARFPSATSVHHDSVELPATCELYAAALDAQLFHLAIEVPVADSKNSTTRPRLFDYDADIDVNLRKMEKDVNQRPSPDYLKTLHGDPRSQSTRARLIFLMEEVTLHFDLAPGTLHRAVSYVDRVLSESERTLLLTHMEYEYELHLLGATAVYTAAKYEEQRTRFKVNAAGIAAYCGFATGKEVIDMELKMVEALQYELSGPTTYTFVDHFTRHSKGDQDLEVQRLAHRLADTSLISYRLLQLLPSAVAASAVFLASLILNPKAIQIQVRQWNKDFEELTGYMPTDLILGIESLCMMNPDPRLEILPAFLQDE